MPGSGAGTGRAARVRWPVIRSPTRASLASASRVSGPASRQSCNSESAARKGGSLMLVLSTAAPVSPAGKKAPSGKAAGKKPYAPLAIAQNLIAAGVTRDPPQIRVLAARQKPSVHRHETLFDAAIACAWDHERYYLWMATYRCIPKNLDNKPNPDAIKLLLVKATEHAKSLGLTFDVDGSDTLGSERLYKEILKIPCVEYRDVYERAPGLSRLFFTVFKPLVSRWL